MSNTNVILYQEGDVSPPPLIEWLDGLQAAARDRCLARLDLLKTYGHELDRPHSAYLGEGIYELRIKYFRVNYRILYFFHGRQAAVVSHGLAKKKEVPEREIKVAVERMKKFQENPRRHTFRPMQE